MKSTVYLETSIISYLASDFSRDLIIATHQQITHDWWNNHRNRFDLRISQLVENEISAGNKEKAEKRLALIKGIPRLTFSLEAVQLAKALVAEGPLPEKAADDALHIALAATHQIDFLLSWNCKHIANMFIQKDLARIMTARGFRLPVIGNPESLMGEPK